MVFANQIWKPQFLSGVQVPFDNCRSPFSPTTVFGIGVCYVPANVTVKCMGQNLDIAMSFLRTERKGLAKLGNIVAETMFLVMFPGVWETYVSDAKFVSGKQKCF